MADDLAARLPGWHATTILMVRKGDKVVIGGDGQVSMGQTVVKSNARKVRPSNMKTPRNEFSKYSASGSVRIILRSISS